VQPWRPSDARARLVKVPCKGDVAEAHCWPTLALALASESFSVDHAGARVYL
jgi:hypothetical protein